MNGDIAKTWESEGWLQFERFFSREEIEPVNALVDALWSERPDHVTVDDVDLLQRTRMSKLKPEQRSHRVKISDLFLSYEPVRNLLLDPRLVAVVERLLGETPVLCNSLNLERSSAQDYHADSLYMTPHTPQKLVACWIALEDVEPGSGPLRFYPGSHRYPPFTFSTGRHAVTAEMPKWAEQMAREIETRKAEPHRVYAKAGDLVLWHADLLHGAEAILDPARTRRSIVGHYFSKSDCRRRGYRIAGDASRPWIKRAPQPVDFPSRVRSAIERRVERMRAWTAAARRRLSRAN